MILTIAELTQIPIPNNINVGKMNAAIQISEQVEIRKLLGDVQYTDLLANKVDAKYVDLLNGTTYVCNSENIIFQGLNAVISNYAYSKYVLTCNIIDTNSGLKIKGSQFSESPEPKLLKAQASMYENFAASLWRDVDLFLCRNSTTYPLYKGAQKAPRAGISIMSIGAD